MPLNLEHMTQEQFALKFWQTLRSAFESGDKERYHKMIWWIWQRVQDGDITNTQARVSYNTAFGKSLTVSEWNTLVSTRLVPAKDRYLAWQAETLV